MKIMWTSKPKISGLYNYDSDWKKSLETSYKPFYFITVFLYLYIILPALFLALILRFPTLGYSLKWYLGLQLLFHRAGWVYIMACEEDYHAYKPCLWGNFTR